jgi:hypothetical protein
VHYVRTRLKNPVFNIPALADPLLRFFYHNRADENYLSAQTKMIGCRDTRRQPRIELAQLEQNQVGFRDFPSAGMSRIKGLDRESR